MTKEERKETWKKQISDVSEALSNYIIESTKPNSGMNVEVVPEMAKVLLDLRGYWGF